MANSLSPTMQNSKIEVLEWLANEQDESFVQEIVSFIKKHTYIRKVEEDFFKPMTEQELTERIMKARNSTKSYTTSEAREMVKNGNR
jgi:hypothetical protein